MPSPSLKGMNVEALMSLRDQVDKRLVELRSELEKQLAALAGAVATARADLHLLSAHRAAGDALDDRIESFQRDVDEIERARGELGQLASSFGPRDPGSASATP